MKPTDEQIKEFWKRCGFEWKHAYHDFYELVSPLGERYDLTVPGFPGYDKIETYPPIDLNNLFGYAVPVVKDKLNNYPEIPTLYPFLSFLDKWCEVVALKEEDPALALFWAIWEVNNDKAKIV